LASDCITQASQYKSFRRDCPESLRDSVDPSQSFFFFFFLGGGTDRARVSKNIQGLTLRSLVVYASDLIMDEKKANRITSQYHIHKCTSQTLEGHQVSLLLQIFGGLFPVPLPRDRHRWFPPSLSYRLLESLYSLRCLNRPMIFQ